MEGTEEKNRKIERDAGSGRSTRDNRTWKRETDGEDNGFGSWIAPQIGGQNRPQRSQHGGIDESAGKHRLCGRKECKNQSKRAPASGTGAAGRQRRWKRETGAGESEKSRET